MLFVCVCVCVLGNPWKFEFRFKFYPARPEYLKDDLTRYFLCLQVRQDIICGQYVIFIFV